MLPFLGPREDLVPSFYIDSFLSFLVVIILGLIQMLLFLGSGQDLAPTLYVLWSLFQAAERKGGGACLPPASGYSKTDSPLQRLTACVLRLWRSSGATTGPSGSHIYPPSLKKMELTRTHPHAPKRRSPSRDLIISTHSKNSTFKSVLSGQSRSMKCLCQCSISVSNPPSSTLLFRQPYVTGAILKLSLHTELFSRKSKL